MTASDGLITLNSDDTTIIIACTIGDQPRILHWGASLRNTAGDAVQLMTTPQHVHGGPDVFLESSLFNEMGSSPPGLSAFSAHRSGQSWAQAFLVERVVETAPGSVSIICRDAAAQIIATSTIALDAETGVMTLSTTVENTGDTELSIDACAAGSLPLDERLSRLSGFTGRWAMEFQREDIPLFSGSYVRENLRGRTSHDSFPGLIAATHSTTEQIGDCFGFHLGWSGNHRLRVDRLNDGRAFVQMGECFLPGEMTLAPGETYQSPCLYAAFAPDGMSGLSRRFHDHLKTRLIDDRIARKPRPIHYNTWEAVYFDHDLDSLKALADKAAEVGVERFILDDGWFGSRRDDTSGLGDWQVSETVYPDGLTPLIDHVKGHGMEFGLWFEPEMVNPDSDLFRAHPDWILKAGGIDLPPARHQYVLDLTRAEVAEHVFGQIHTVLTDHDIDYIKWDMNRDIHHPGSEGQAVASEQTRAVYALMDRIRASHPHLEIESCASGGGRADYGVLSRTDRIWTSDSNDALDRQLIQRGASYFFPLDVMGAHVGPARCHITGRRLSMSLRVATAFFGHMGLELDLLKERPKDIETLKAGLALHKQHRALLHGGAFHRLETPSHANAVGVVATDASDALFSWCNLSGHVETHPGRLFAVGLDAAKSYRVRLIWPVRPISPTQPSIIEAADLLGDGAILSGEALMTVGLQLPHTLPETCLIFHMEAE